MKTFFLIATLCAFFTSCSFNKNKEAARSLAQATNPEWQKSERWQTWVQKNYRPQLAGRMLDPRSGLGHNIIKKSDFAKCGANVTLDSDHFERFWLLNNTNPSEVKSALSAIPTHSSVLENVNHLNCLFQNFPDHKYIKDCGVNGMIEINSLAPNKEEMQKLTLEEANTLLNNFLDYKNKEMIDQIICVYSSQTIEAHESNLNNWGISLEPKDPNLGKTKEFGDKSSGVQDQGAE